MHIPIKKDDQYKTAFVVPNAKYHWTVLPHGLTDAAFSLAFVMNEVLREFQFTKSFFDDCLIFGNKDEHISQVEVLNKFAELGIHVNMSKCQFMKPEVNFIGLTITNAGIRPNANKLQELVEFNKPENTKELRSFLGIASYFRRFINKFSETASSLYALLKKNVPFVWSEECETSYNKLRTGLQTAAVLRHTDKPSC